MSQTHRKDAVVVLLIWKLT